MKKILFAIAVALAIFMALLYWSAGSTKKTFDTCSLVDGRDMDDIDFKNHDSVLVIPNDLYDSNLIKTIMQGQQYREAWAAPNKFPIVFLDTLFGGVTVIDEGGGKQTHSLDIKDKQGIVYSLRSINKNPEPLIPEVLKQLNLENIVVDGISAQHPYGALLAAKLAEAVGLLHTNPQAVFIPKQKALGMYNAKYGNRLFLLEYETEGKINWTKIPNVLEIMDTDDLQEFKMEQGEKLSINKNAFIRARLFDMVIGDWDRHGKQWGWVIEQKDEAFLAHPLAGDRDNAFFNLDGIVPSIVSNKHITPKLRPFEDDIDFMAGLVYRIDRYFLLNTDEALFIEQAEILQQLLTDEAIDNAFKVWPKPIAELNQGGITEKLKSRRDNLVEYAKKFKNTIDELGELEKPVRGSEDVKLSGGLKRCFDCS